MKEGRPDIKGRHMKCVLIYEKHEQVPRPTICEHCLEYVLNIAGGSLRALNNTRTQIWGPECTQEECVP